MKARFSFASAGILLAIACLTRLAAQGTLTPPGAPAPLMKTLDQVEPRTVLVDGGPDTPAVVTSHADYHFIIREPGSYYLPGNLLVRKLNGILVKAPGVTLDLMGFALTRDATLPDGHAIEIDAVANRCAIRHGTIDGGNDIRFAYGLLCQTTESVGARAGSIEALKVFHCMTGIQTSEAWTLTGCQVHESAKSGIFAGPDSSLTDCLARMNGEYGIYALERANLTRCTANDNGFDGIEAASDSVLSRCIANNNGANGIEATAAVIRDCSADDNTRNGIYCSSSTLSHCKATGNGFSGIDGTYGSNVSFCTSNNNTEEGIEVSDRSMITESVCYGNDGSGIYLSGEFNTVRNCNVAFNRREGIFVEGASNRIIGNHVTRSTNGGITISSTTLSGHHSHNVIEDNTLSNNVIGISISAPDNLITRNRVTASTAGTSFNYAIIANNHVGVIISAPLSGAISGTGGAGLGTSNPWANFSF